MIPTPGSVCVAHNPSDFRHSGVGGRVRGADKAVMPEGKDVSRAERGRRRVVDAFASRCRANW